MADTVRWGILGTGKIARAFASAVPDVPGAVLAGVASRSLDKARGFAGEVKAGAAYGSYEELVAAADIDLVYVATPHPQHAQNALLALRAGKGVLCEKPFTMNLREAEQVVTLARTRRLFLMEAMWTRFLPALAEVKRIIALGEIGEARQVVADFGFTASFGPEHRVFNPELGGGALLDLGIYPLSIAASLLGPVLEVRAQAEMGPTGVDVQTGFTLKHEGGAMSVCSCSFLARTPGELTVSGSRGHVRMNTMFHRATSVTVELEDGTTRTIATPYVGNGYVHQVIEAQRCYLAGLLESPHMTHDETLALMGVMDEIRRQIGLVYEADGAR
ncbi:Gfo/Idh/MocA family oxidoreductase [Massilia sp. Dwa41.01b]|uniref:Gfo/Idh/MocA family protein n=1 Tax=unclassified Massilia TaxID=2609279 RepID=UPI00160039B9|nr:MULTISPECIES: Gfo/Idh/MocA family oxidoreductase [unclassified Massilia]QNA87522.1 Gfo/Idh/MocA family oxidoreductase [Massilia sp. Dwa41.01b]QNA98429.1 Gfo/Idh/MocA family oxidoreductase [Massilia sp. Se16.2.3]